MNIKKFILPCFFALFLFNYFGFCPELRKIELSNDTTWSTPEIFENLDGAIIGLYFPKIQLIFNGKYIIVVIGSNTLTLKDLTILPNDPDALCFQDPQAKLVLENCTFLLNETNLNLTVGNIKIIGNVEFTGLNPNIIKRTLAWFLSWAITQELSERFILDYPLIIFPHWAHVARNSDCQLVFEKTIPETNWLLPEPEPKRSIKKKVHFDKSLT